MLGEIGSDELGLQTVDKKNLMIDLFCGTGGFSKGFTKNGLDLLYGVDIDHSAVETAQANHPESLIEVNDILKVKIPDLANRIGTNHVDLIIGGPPCQGFSSLRPNRSTNNNDSRNNLYKKFLEFVQFFNPKVFLMENVVGIITHDSGKTLSNILVDFHNAGYECDWKILNAAHYGVPQKRERFILIGNRIGVDNLFPTPTFHFEGSVVGSRDRTRMFVTSSDKLPPAITVNQAISDLPPLDRGEQSRKYHSKPKNSYQKSRVGGNRELSLHKAANHSDKMMEIIRHSGPNIHSIPKHLISSGFSSCYSRLDGNAPSNTITVKFQSPASNRCIHPTQNRSITPREAARIQSFDDSYIFKGSMTSISSQIGNAVPPLLGYHISSMIRNMLGEK